MAVKYRDVYPPLMARTDPQVNFRIPADLNDRLKAAAVENNRTITAELVSRLEASFQPVARTHTDEVESIIEKTVDTAMRVMEKRGWTPPPLEAKPTAKRIPRSKPPR